MKAIHRDLQIYIGVFNRLYELQKEENRMENEKNDILDQLKQLREKTRELLCFMEDMLNGTDSMRIRVKYISDSVMKKKVNTIETQSLHMDIVSFFFNSNQTISIETNFIFTLQQRALTSVKTFVTELEKFIDKRIRVLESHKKNINPTKCKKMRKCSKRLRMKERTKKMQEKKHRRHHSRGARIRNLHIGKA